MIAEFVMIEDIKPILFYIIFYKKMNGIVKR